jgi:hypothetical protein
MPQIRAAVRSWTAPGSAPGDPQNLAHWAGDDLQVHPVLAVLAGGERPAGRDPADRDERPIDHHERMPAARSAVSSFGLRAASSATVSWTYRQAVAAPMLNPAASAAKVSPLAQMHQGQQGLLRPVYGDRARVEIDLSAHGPSRCGRRPRRDTTPYAVSRCWLLGPTWSRMLTVWSRVMARDGRLPCRDDDQARGVAADLVAGLNVPDRALHDLVEAASQIREAPVRHS